MPASTSNRVLFSRTVLTPTGPGDIGQALTTIQSALLDPGALCLVQSAHAIYEWRPESVAAVEAPFVVAASEGSGSPGRWHQVGLVANGTAGYDLQGLPLHDYYDSDSGVVALDAGTDWVELWSLAGTSFLADTLVRRLGISVAFEAVAASLKDDEQLLLTVERTGSTYTLCDKTNRTASSTTSITGAFTGQANGLTQNWRLRNDAGTLRFEVQEDAGGARTARGRFWYGEQK